MKTNNSAPLTMRKRRIAIATQALLATPALAMAGQAVAEEEAIQLDTLVAEERTIDTNPYAEEGAPYKAKVSGDARYTKPLAETPKTITVMTQTAIKESGKTDLKDVLAAQPGISLGTGENGNAFGDRYVIRGHEARSDVFVDGLRDPGMTTRESFAVDQVEITKGPSSSFAGRGSTGGAVNSITKQASTDYNFNKVEAGVGTDSYRRVTVDSNVPVSDTVAVRANVLHSYQEVPDRGPADRERNGVALSAAWEATDDLTITGDYYHLSAFDNPDLGSYINRTTGKVAKDIPVYAQEEDFVKSRVDTFTLRADWRLSDAVRLTNTLRHGTTNNGYYVTGASGSTAYVTDDASNITTDTADSFDSYSTISLSSHQGWQEVEYVANQTNLYIEFDLAGMEHDFIVGTEYSKHDVLNGAYTATANGESNCVTSGRGGYSNSYCLIDENGNEVDNINSLMQREISKGDWDSNYQIDTISAYVMDTVEITEDFTVFAGLRADKYEYSNLVFGRGSTEATRYEFDDVLFNYHLGLVYDVADNANVYFTAATADNINGGESDVGGSCGYGGICGDATNADQAEPEHTTSFEVGTKWNVNDEKLLLTAAAFYIDKKDVMEGADYETTGTQNTGGNRVKGIELTAAGNITEKLSTIGGLSIMESEITDSYNEDNIGGRLANFADKSLYTQLRYQATDKVAFGGAVTYASESYVGQPDSAAGDLHTPAYTVVDAFMSYDINNTTNYRINVGNLFDTDYYTAAYRSGSFAYKGDARNIKMTLAFEF